MIRAQISKDVVTQSSQSAVILTAAFALSYVPTTRTRGLPVFASGLNPLHRFAELHRDPSEQRFLGIDIQFGAKTAADFRSNHAELVFRNADHESHLGTHQVRY